MFHNVKATDFWSKKSPSAPLDESRSGSVNHEIQSAIHRLRTIYSKNSIFQIKHESVGIFLVKTLDADLMGGVASL